MGKSQKVVTLVSRLLLNQKPLVILPELATVIGLNEAIVLQQVHYWLEGETNVLEGRKWVYNSYPDWQEQFPFWSISTIRRAIASLEEKGLLIVANYNKLKADRTKWYSIDYDVVDYYEEKGGLSRPSVQNEQMDCSKRADDTSVQNEQTNTREEITTENINTSVQPPIKPAANKKAASPKIQYADFVTLTEAEHQSLLDKHGQAVTVQLIAKLNDYKGAHGKKYKSDYHAIHSWVLKAYLEEQERKPKEKGYQAKEIV